MSLLDFLKGSYEVANWTPLRPKASTWYGEQFSRNTAGIPVNSETALNSGTAMACTRAISETLASLPALVMEQVSPSERRKARENPMWTLLHDQPNPMMDSMTWYEINATRVVNRGNGVNLIERNGAGVPMALWPVHNSRFEIFRRAGVAIGNGRFTPGDVFYRIWPDETERHFDVMPEEILNIVSWDTDNGLIGKSVVERAKSEIGLDTAQQEYSSSMFENGALPLGMIKHPWIDDEEQRENLRADLNSVHSGRENWNKLGILWDKDADWVKLNFSPEDVQAIQSRTFTSKALCRYYNVPPAVVQIYDDYKFATVEAMLKHFIMLTIRPYAVRFERAINSQMLNSLGEDLFLEFALEALLRGDPEAQARTNAIYRGWGVLNADEIRQRDLAMNPLPDGMGEEYLVPLNHGVVGEEPVPQQAPPTDSGANTHSVLEAVFRGMMVREADQIRRRANAGPVGFLAKVEAYYDETRGLMCHVVKLASNEADEEVADMVSAHIRESVESLLAACECQPARFQASVGECLASWKYRELSYVTSAAA